MKVLKEVEPIEVKRAFVIADHVAHLHGRKKRGNNKKFLKALSEAELQKKIVETKKEILRVKESDLDRLVCPEWPKRLNAYNMSRWFIADIRPKDVGVWARAGGLPLRWTNRSLAETAKKMERGLKMDSKSIKSRAKHAIPNILKMKSQLDQEERYLYPIVFRSDTGTMGRKRLKRKMVGDIDDGCMRSIALAMSGKRIIRVYFGSPLK